MFLSADILSLLPNFQDSAHRLHDALVPVSFCVCVAGVTLYGAHAALHKTLATVFPMLVRLYVVSILIGSLGAWGTLLKGAVREVVSLMGINASGANPGNAFEAYRNAIANKWGTNAVAQSQQQVHNAAAGQQPLQSSVNTSTEITHYGYLGDTTPDWNSAHGIGNHNNQLVAGQSLAISPDIAQQYGLQVGQTVSITMANGQTIRGVYDDTTGNDPNTGQPLTSRVDIYDPNNQYGFLSGEGVSGINGLGVQAAPATGTNGGGIGGFLKGLSDATMLALAGPIVYVASLGAAALMWLVDSVVQPILFLCEIAISPLFLAMLMVPALVSIASQFLLSFVALCLWPLAWALANLVTVALVDMAANPTNDNALAFPGAPWGVWLALIVWILVAYALAPIVITKAFVGGHSGLSTLISASFLAVSSAARPNSLVQRSAGALIGAGSRALNAGGSNGNNGNGALPAPPPARAGRGNFAVRPAARNRVGS